MVIHKADIIFPCPFSKAYGIPSQQAWKLMIFFLSYRVVLSSALLLLQYLHLQPAPFNITDPKLFLWSSESYCAITIVFASSIFFRRIPYAPQAQLLIFTDIIAITLLLHASGGISSGLGILLIISVTFGGILIGGHCAMVFAAIASMAVLCEQYYALQINRSNLSNYTESGLLGAALFTTAFLAYVLAKRSEQSQLIAQQHKQTILKLEDLNRSIIQHLQAGIIIATRFQQVLMTNQTALNLLNIYVQPRIIQDISLELAEAFSTWLTHVDGNFVQITRQDQSQIHCRFSFLPTQQEMLFMITLEDAALYNQRLQQSKLASLGRLTASIAHEIRNPLGAISHATQLLTESPNLNPQDVRLTEIIQTHSLRINNIIEEILQLSRRKTSNRQKIAINSWLKNYIQEFIAYQNIKPEQISLALSPHDLHALIDPDHLKQILDNLCLNAIKHNTRSDSCVTLATEYSAKGICINVTDNGNKISPTVIEHLFEPFFTTSNTGTGLGLYISKELAELNQAKLFYQTSLSTPMHERFNCFKLSLPDAEQPTLEL